MRHISVRHRLPKLLWIKDNQKLYRPPVAFHLGFTRELLHGEPPAAAVTEESCLVGSTSHGSNLMACHAVPHPLRSLVCRSIIGTYYWPTHFYAKHTLRNRWEQEVISWKLRKLRAQNSSAENASLAITAPLYSFNITAEPRFGGLRAEEFVTGFFYHEGSQWPTVYHSSCKRNTRFNNIVM